MREGGGVRETEGEEGREWETEGEGDRRGEWEYSGTSNPVIPR